MWSFNDKYCDGEIGLNLHWEEIAIGFGWIIVLFVVFETIRKLLICCVVACKNRKKKSGYSQLGNDEYNQANWYDQMDVEEN